MVEDKVDSVDSFDSLDEWVLESNFYVTLKDKLSTLPTSPGVYLMKNSLGDIIYVGKAVVLKNRVRSYFQKLGKDISGKVRRMVHDIADLEWIVTDTELEALILESNLIKKYRPHYNVRLKDDKSYPYIAITMRDRFPKPMFMRKIRSDAKDGNKYFGPYTDSNAVRETLRLIRRVFKVPCGYTDTTQSKGRACLYYHIGQCLGPCAGEVTEEEYRQVIKDVITFLEGRQEKLLKELQSQMEEASEKLLFEKAARLRDQAQAMQRIVERQKVISNAMTDQDVVALVTDNGNAIAQMFFIRSGKLIGQEHFLLEGTSSDDLSEGVREFVKQYYQTAAYVPKEILLQYEIDEIKIIESWLRQKRGTKVDISHPVRGEKRQLVEMAEKNAETVLNQLRKKIETDEAMVTSELSELQTGLDLPKPPRRIECYDISNIMGTEAVGSLVVFENGKPKKSDYRRFKIKYTPEQPDDYAMMREVLARRITGKLRQTEKFANLPDLLMVDGGKGQLNVAVEVLNAFDEEVSVIGLAKEFEEVFKPGESDPRILPRASKGLHLLQRVRDEAHRFAIEYHRKLRAKRMTKSILTEIPGIGKKRRSALLKHFGSLKKIREASLEELEQAPTMTKPAAETVYSYVREIGNR
ncbi:MAG: excinuclease ABC subunit UvrC [Armatimonadota bacterium]